MSEHEQVSRAARRWRLAFFGALGAGAICVLAALQPIGQPGPLIPFGGVTWVPDSDDHPTLGRLVGLSRDGRLIESERQNGTWLAWRVARQEHPTDRRP